MAFRPYNRHTATVNVPLSTVAVVQGQLLTRVGDGSFTDSISMTTVLPIQFVAAESVDNSGGTVTTSCLAYPATEDVRWEAICSGAVIQTNIGEKYIFETDLVVGNGTAIVGGGFLIEEIKDASAKLVIGRFINPGATSGA